MYNLYGWPAVVDEAVKLRDMIAFLPDAVPADVAAAEHIVGLRLPAGSAAMTLPLSPTPPRIVRLLLLE